MEKLTKQMLETLRYRKERLEHKAGQVERLLSGREKSLLPLLRDKNGRYSEKKTRALAEKLVQALDLYRQGRNAREGEKDRPLSAFPSALEEDKRGFYRSFLYCLLRLAEDPPNWSFPCKGTFGDLLEMGRDIAAYKEEELFYLDTVYRGVYASEVWLWLDRACEAFTGEKMEDRITQSEIEAVEARYPSEVAEAAEQAAFEETLKDDSRFEDPDAETLEAWELEELEKEEVQRQAWLDNFPEKESFCREYLSWRRAYFDLRAWNWLEEHMQAMLEVYLCQDGSSSFLCDETYFSAYALLDRAVRELRKLLDVQE